MVHRIAVKKYFPLGFQGWSYDLEIENSITKHQKLDLKSIGVCKARPSSREYASDRTDHCAPSLQDLAEK